MVSMEISDEYESITSRLHNSDNKRGELDVIASDFSVLLETVMELDGGTRNTIADQLPDEMTVSYDSQAVVDALQVLERYELVVLERNTWKSGPTLRT